MKFVEELGCEAAINVFANLTHTLLDLAEIVYKEDVSMDELCLCAEEQGFLPQRKKELK